MTDNINFIVAFQEFRQQSEQIMNRCNTKQLENMTRYAHYPNDWLRFMRMSMGGPPALMRAAQRRNGATKDDVWEPGTARPEVCWFYIAKEGDVAPNTTFSKLEEQYGELRKLLGETAR